MGMGITRPTEDGRRFNMNPLGTLVKMMVLKLLVNACERTRGASYLFNCLLKDRCMKCQQRDADADNNKLHNAYEYFLHPSSINILLLLKKNDLASSQCIFQKDRKKTRSHSKISCVILDC
jgi:hypothetical protein